ncbi:uncharacterized protein PV09_02546 [Verruconis gallopava]|uniref:DUF1445 domain-containing protein n=1 Tax=Verruconis gallopava TaxID=253628 RepID=A0A0D2AJX7_9PEZI|nr:uncharacterized protein PV09_02546 [Verruconis gallopava]KIW06870.1 hypothetical protein PV09_02546 [Verruconis gallopava]
MTKNEIQDYSKATGRDVRLAARSGDLTTPTTGLAAGYLQANLIILPANYADDFRQLCQRNPVPCPLLAESASPGDFRNLKSHIPGISGQQIASDLDLRKDAPRYVVYKDADEVKGQKGCLDIERWWADDHIAFLIGCSFSFENALMEKGLVVKHILHGRNVSMYRTTMPLCDAGRFQKRSYVVSMRPYELGEVEAVKAVTRPFGLTHGEPLGWGWQTAEALGIKDITKPEYGDAPVCADGTPFTRDSREVPVFWGCGVTPQNAVVGNSISGIVLGHLPGHMLVLDLREEDVFKR